jgi:acetyl esterase/lipase
MPPAVATDDRSSNARVRAVVEAGLLAAAVATTLLAVGCGGGRAGGDAPTPTPSAADAAGAPTPTADAHPVVQQTVGSGATQVWVFRRAGLEPRSVVVFLHGLGDAAEGTPEHHLPWLRHLAAKGSTVVFPRYERYPGDPLAPQFLLRVMQALARDTDLDEKPLLLLGYSRGGGLAVAYSTVAGAAGMVPRTVVGVFPAVNDRQLDPAGTAPGTRFVFYVGERDTVVAGRGADALRRWLLANGYPRGLVRVSRVRATASFSATHLAPIREPAGARAALWAPVDRLVAEVRARG